MQTRDEQTVREAVGAFVAIAGAATLVLSYALGARISEGARAGAAEVGSGFLVFGELFFRGARASRLRIPVFGLLIGALYFVGWRGAAVTAIVLIASGLTVVTFVIRPLAARRRAAPNKTNVS